MSVCLYLKTYEKVWVVKNNFDTNDTDNDNYVKMSFLAPKENIDEAFALLLFHKYHSNLFSPPHITQFICS